jgi:RimJ/RimL family protein N-acetyltransferase
MTQIKTERLVLRPWKKGDEDSLVSLANNRKIWINVRDLFPHPYTHEDAQNWIHLSKSNPLHHNFALQWKEHLIGGIGLHRLSDVYRRAAEIGYWIGEPFWGEGFCTEGVKAVTEWGFENLDLSNQAGFSNINLPR